MLQLKLFHHHHIIPRKNIELLQEIVVHKNKNIENHLTKDHKESKHNNLREVTNTNNNPFILYRFDDTTQNDNNLFCLNYIDINNSGVVRNDIFGKKYHHRYNNGYNTNKEKIN